MEARWIRFGEIEIDGRRYAHDVVIQNGRVGKRSKKPSKAFRAEFGHTPISMAETIPWSGRRLLIGTGAEGRLPVMTEVLDEARRRGIEVDRLTTDAACRRLRDLEPKEVNAILHVTC